MLIRVNSNFSLFLDKLKSTLNERENVWTQLKSLTNEFDGVRAQLKVTTIELEETKSQLEITQSISHLYTYLSFEFERETKQNQRMGFHF